MKWLSFFWYRYLFTDLKWCDNFWHKIIVISCRIQGHPNGPGWYSNGLEPDMTCKDCGDEL
jgi:hypothetical protein